MTKWLKVVRDRLRWLLRADVVEQDIDEELRCHIEIVTEENIRRGMTPEEARMQAVRSFGNLGRVKERARDIRGGGMMETLFQDLRFGLRMMRKAPGFTAVAVLSLALGIGANTVLFSLVDAVLLKSLPVKEPDRLVQLNWQAGRAFRTTGLRGTFVDGYPPGIYGSSSFQHRVYEKMREQDSPLSDLFAFAWLRELNVLADGQAETATGQAVSGNYFTGLGVSPLIGRVIMEADDQAAATPVVVLSYRYWQERFGGDSSVVGKQMNLNKTSFTVIGVTPPAFTGTLQVDQHPAITVPLAFEPVLESERPMIDKPEKLAPWWLNLMGRLKPGATIEQTRESLNGIFQQTALEIMPPPKKANDPVTLEPKDYPNLVISPGSRGLWESRKAYSSSIYILFGIVGLVLLIACANVANLLLARAALRAPEITVRLAVGAGRWRLIRQLLTESVLLAALGGLIGALFALWGKGVLATMGKGDFLPTDIDYSLNWRVLGFTIAISLLTGILFGIAPAWRATSPDLTTALKESHRSSSVASRSRLSKALVIVQVAMSLLLLVGAGLMVRTLRNLQQVELGFNQENLLLFSLQPRSLGYKKERLIQLYQRLFERLDTIPGARSATFANFPLVAHYVNSTSLILPGETSQSSEVHETNVQAVRANYLATMEIPLLRGRDFSDRDDQHAPKVAIVSETLAHKFFSDEDPIGKRFRLDAEAIDEIEIIGIARDIKYNSQREEKMPMLYLPWLQSVETIGEMCFTIRATGDPIALVSAARQSVSEVDSNLPLVGVKTQEVQLSETLTQERLFANLLSFFGLLALLLAAIGLYGVLAYSVAQRTGEIGIRMALGARSGNVLRMVVWQGMKLVLIGSVVGAFAAFALKGVIASQLYGVGASDPLTFSVAGALLLLIALFACWIPAHRATKVDPMIALRNE